MLCAVCYAAGRAARVMILEVLLLCAVCDAAGRVAGADDSGGAAVCCV